MACVYCNESHDWRVACPEYRDHIAGLKPDLVIIDDPISFSYREATTDLPCFEIDYTEKPPLAVSFIMRAWRWWRRLQRLGPREF